MGVTSNSFKRQIGRDAGKVVSNFIFGDKHSTPYRRVASTRAQQRTIAEERKTKMQETQNLHAVDAAVINAVDQVIAAPVSDDEKSLVKLMNELEIQLAAVKWKETGGDDEEAKIRNKYPDAVLQKYKQCVRELKFIGANEERIKYHKSRYKRLRRKKIWGKNKTVIIAVSLFIVGFLIMLIAAGL